MTQVQVRLAVEKVLPVTKRKSWRWFPVSRGKRQSIPVYLLLRDVLKLSNSRREAGKVIKAGKVLVDGRPCRKPEYPVCFMSVIELPSTGKSYRLDYVGRKLLPVETERSQYITYKIVNKNIVRGGKVSLTFHDGRNMPADNSYKVGNSVLYDLKERKVVQQLKFEPDAICIVTAGKHIGTRVRLVRAFSVGRKKECEVKALDGTESFVTLASYLMTVDPKYL